MKRHHAMWLVANPDKTEEWLLGMLSEGFHVHHIDGDRLNNEPDNLALIYGPDHGRFHQRFKPTRYGGRRDRRSDIVSDADAYRRIVKAYASPMKD